jgi:hypothetical protein
MSAAAAHAFPDHSGPRVGHSVEPPELAALKLMLPLGERAGKVVTRMMQVWGKSEARMEFLLKRRASEVPNRTQKRMVQGGD